MSTAAVPIKANGTIELAVRGAENANIDAGAFEAENHNDKLQVEVYYGKEESITIDLCTSCTSYEGLTGTVRRIFKIPSDLSFMLNWKGLATDDEFPLINDYIFQIALKYVRSQDPETKMVIYSVYGDKEVDTLMSEASKGMMGRHSGPEKSQDGTGSLSLLARRRFTIIKSSPSLRMRTTTTTHLMIWASTFMKALKAGSDLWGSACPTAATPPSINFARLSQCLHTTRLL